MVTVIGVVPSVAAVLAAVTAILVWRRGNGSPLMRPPALFLFGCAWWSTCRAASSIATDPDLKVALELSPFPGAALPAAAAFSHFLVLTGHGRVLNRRTIGHLRLELALLVVAIRTNRWQRLFCADVELGAPKGPATTYCPPF
jgi:N-terminal 7TM region of histidine kinase